MFKTEISVIIPVFRIRNYLRPCIESILMQDFDLPFNIMLIETGSDDGSDLICHEYEMKYPGKVYHFHYDKNVGISFARNLGILHANGKYIAFVDGDDVLKEGFLSSLYHQVENDTDLQVIFGGYDFLYDDGMTKKAKSPFFYGNGKKALRIFYKSYDFYRGYCWGGLYKRDFILLNHLCFDCEMKLYEDMLFLYETLYLANKVSFIDEPLYLYRKHDGSTMAIHHDWLDYHLKCLKKFQSFLKLDKASIRYFSKPTKALKRQLRLDCQASSVQGTNPKKLYSQTIRKLKR